MKRVLIGVPTGWHMSALWQANHMQKLGEQRTDEIAIHYEPSNTKACSYSNLILKAYEGGFSHLVLWETNVIIEVALQTLLKRLEQFHCVMSPGVFQDFTIGCEPVFLDDSRDAIHEYPSELYHTEDGQSFREFSPIEIRWGCTHLVGMDEAVIRKLVKEGQRFIWAKKSTKLDHDMPIYCYDGDTMPDHPDPHVRQDEEPINPARRLAIEQSLYSNIRALGFGVWADPVLWTTNVRLGGSFPSFRYSNYVQEEK
jgi:hypothetical protein